MINKQTAHISANMLIEYSEQDSDPVSSFMDGENRAVFVVKGREQIAAFCKFIGDNGWWNPAKNVADNDSDGEQWDEVIN